MMSDHHVRARTDNKRINKTRILDQFIPKSTLMIAEPLSIYTECFTTIATKTTVNEQTEAN